MNLEQWILMALLAAGAETAVPALRARPRLLSPRPGATIVQNDPGSGCSGHPVMGFGYHVDLQWAPVTGAAEYEVVVEFKPAPAPTLQSRVTRPRASFTRCHAYVIDTNLDRWRWRVRGLDRQGRPGPWSAPRALRFSPCRAPDGGPCGSRGAPWATASASGASPAGRLHAPLPVSPPHGATFSHRWPRLTQLAWTEVPGAVAYDVYLDCFGCCATGRWCSEIEGEESTRHQVDGPTWSFEWYGTQPGRWRVRAVGTGGEGGVPSPWWMFVFRY